MEILHLFCNEILQRDEREGNETVTNLVYKPELQLHH